jgi:hypothetical protein
MPSSLFPSKPSSSHEYSLTTERPQECAFKAITLSWVAEIDINILDISFIPFNENESGVVSDRIIIPLFF